LGAVVLADARRGGAKNQIRSADARVGFRCLYRAIERLPLSFVVGFVVALIQDDEPGVRQRYEQGAARPDNNRKFAFARAPPGVVQLAFGQLGVVQPDAVGEARHVAAHCLRGHGNFGHQNDDLPAARQSLLDRAQVNLGLARACDAVQQDWRALRLAEPREQLLPDALLVRCEGGGMCAFDMQVFQRVAPNLGFVEVQVILLREGFQVRVGAVGLGVNPGEIHRERFGGQQLQDLQAACACFEARAERSGFQLAYRFRRDGKLGGAHDFRAYPRRGKHAGGAHQAGFAQTLQTAAPFQLGQGMFNLSTTQGSAL